MDFIGDPPHTQAKMSSFTHNPSYSALAQIEAYWDALRGTRLMPKRSEIDPRGLELALEHTFILERISAGMARLRIAGTHLSDLMGMEVRGMPVTSFVTPDGRRQVSDMLEEVFQRPAICELRLSAGPSFDRPRMDAQMLLLPLKSDLGDVSRVLGCLVAHGDVGRTPRRFDVVGSRVRTITSSESAPDAPQDTAEARMPASGFAEPAEHFAGNSVKTNVPYLRVVKDD